MVFSKLKNLLRWAKISGAGSDDKQFPVQQVTYKGKVGDCIMIFPYGYHANLTDDSLVAMFAMEGNPENRAGIGWTPQTRPTLVEGEVALYQPTTDTIIKLSQNGDIDIETGSANINVNTTQANITASDSVTVDTPETTITGNVTINGDTQIDGTLNVDGDITGLSDIIATALVQGATLTITGNGSIGGKDYITHTHAQGNDSGGDSQVNTGGVV